MLILRSGLWSAFRPDISGTRYHSPARSGGGQAADCRHGGGPFPTPAFPELAQPISGTHPPSIPTASATAHDRWMGPGSPSGRPGKQGGCFNPHPLFSRNLRSKYPGPIATHLSRPGGGKHWWMAPGSPSGRPGKQDGCFDPPPPVFPEFAKQISGTHRDTSQPPRRRKALVDGSRRSLRSAGKTRWVVLREIAASYSPDARL